MLLRFSLENYKNFKDKQTIYFNIEKNREDEYKDEDKIDSNTFAADNERFLKTIAIYGANGTGKSNLIRAIFFVREFIIRAPNSGMPSTLIAHISWLKDFKLDEEMAEKPSSFELEFIVNKKHYKYFFSCNNTKIFEEKLDILNTETKRFNCLYARNKEIKVFDDKLKVQTENIKSQLRENSLFLSLLISSNITFAKEIYDFLYNRIIVIPADSTSGNTTFDMIVENGSEKDEIINFLNLLDINVSNIEAQEIQLNQNVAGKQVFFERTNRENKKIIFNIQEESQGTVKIFNLIGDLLKVIKTGSMIFIDELDCHLHIKLLKYLIELFNRNNNGAQLIFTTHNTTILNKRYNLFRRDQILIINRENNEENIIYSLADVKGVQKNINFEDLLLEDLVGGNPIVGGYYV